MTHDWRPRQESSWVRPSAALVAAALFLVGLAAFLFALLRPFDEPRLFLLTCDGDPATVGAAPLESLAAANSRGTISHAINAPPGPGWLQAIEEFGDRMTPRDTVLVYLRGAWADHPEPAFRSPRAATGAASAEALKVDEILALLAKLPAEKIILALDDSDPELDQFSEQLEKLRSKATTNPGGVGRVLIITAHRVGEESFPLPGRQCTAFGQVLAQAFSEAADRNHDDGISLHEFLAAVRQQVGGWAAKLTAGRESQTPFVIEAASLPPDAILCPVLRRMEDRPSSGNGSDGGSETAGDSGGGLAGGAADGSESPAVPLEQINGMWRLAEELTSRAIQGEVPLVICRGLQRDLLELERRWRFGETSADLRSQFTSLHTTLAALAAGDPRPSDARLWARDLGRLLQNGAYPDDFGTTAPPTGDEPSAQPQESQPPLGSRRPHQFISTAAKDTMAALSGTLVAPPEVNQAEAAVLTELAKMISGGAARETVQKRMAAADRPPQCRSWLLAQKLTDTSALPDELWRDVLTTRLRLKLDGEHLAASSWAAVPRTAAERAALRAERLLLDQAERNWLKRAMHANRTAEAAVARAQAVDELHATATVLCRRTILDLPDLLDADRRLQFWENDPSEVGTILDRMLESLASLRTALHRETLDDPGNVERLVQSLQMDRLRLLQPVRQITAQVTTSGTAPPAMDIIRLLRSTLLSPQERSDMLAVWPQMAAGLPATAPRPTAAGKVIVRGLADGLAKNSLRRERFESLCAGRPLAELTGGVGIAKDADAATAAGDGNLLDMLEQFETEAAQRRMRRPGTIRQRLAELLDAPLDADSFSQCRVLWDSFDGLQEEWQLPPSWLQLADRLRLCRKIRRLDRHIRLVQLSRNDAADWERVCYERDEAGLRAARSYYERWPAPERTPSPVLRGPRRLPLGNDAAAELVFHVDGLADRRVPAHLTVQYDDEQYVVSLQDGQPVVSAETPPWPYTDAAVGTGVPIRLDSKEPRSFTLFVQPTSAGARPGPLLVRLQGPDWTVRATCELMPPRKLPVELVLEDEFGPVVNDERGYTVEPYPNRTGTLRWSLRNNSADAQHVRIAIYTADEEPDALPEYVVPSRSVAELLRTLPPHELAVEVAAIEVPAAALGTPRLPQPVLFPKQDDSKHPVTMPGGLIVVLSDETSGLAQLHRVRFRSQRPQRFVDARVEYERTNGRITAYVKAKEELKETGRLPAEGIPVVVRLAGAVVRPLPARTTGRLTLGSPQAALTLLAEPGSNHRIELDVAGWPRAFVYEIADGEPSLLRRPAIRMTAPAAGAVYQTAEVIPVSVEVDVPAAGFVTAEDRLEIGVDTNHDRRLEGETTVQVDRDRHVMVHWLGAAPDGSTRFQVDVGDFELMLPTNGLRNQRASLRGRVAVAGEPEVWGDAVPLVFDSTPPQLKNVELRPGPTVVIGEPVVLLADADDAGLSGVSQVEAGFDPDRSGRFDESVKPVAAVPLEDGRWRVEIPTDKLEQGRHLLLARALDRAGNAELPHLLWVEAITPEQAAARQSERTARFEGQILYGTEPVSGIKVHLTSDQTDAEAAADPMNTESAEKSPSPEKPPSSKQSSSPEKSFTATSGKDGKFLIPAVTGGPFVLRIEGVLRGEKFDRQSKVTIDVGHPPAPLTVRLDRPPESPDDKP